VRSNDLIKRIMPGRVVNWMARQALRADAVAVFDSRQKGPRRLQYLMGHVAADVARPQRVLVAYDPARLGRYGDWTIGVGPKALKMVDMVTTIFYNRSNHKRSQRSPVYRGGSLYNDRPKYFDTVVIPGHSSAKVAFEGVTPLPAGGVRRGQGVQWDNNGAPFKDYSLANGRWNVK
jgi:hypothetical protein